MAIFTKLINHQIMSNRVASNNLVMSYKPGRQREQLPIAIDGKPKHGTG